MHLPVKNKPDLTKPPLVAPPQVNTITQLGEASIPVADGKFARVPFPMTEDDFEMFLGTLNLWKKKLVQKLPAIPPAIKLPADAVWRNNNHDVPVKIVAFMGERDGEKYYQSQDGTGIPESQLKF